MGVIGEAAGRDEAALQFELDVHEVLDGVLSMLVRFPGARSRRWCRFLREEPDLGEEANVGVIGEAAGRDEAALQFELDVHEVLDGVLSMLVRKNAAYGDSALSPLRVFSRADAVEQIKVRIDAKLSRLARGAGEETEDVELDLMGYIVLLRVARLRAERGCAS